MDRRTAEMKPEPPPEFDRYAERYEKDLQDTIPAALAESRYFAEYKVEHVAHRLGGAQPRTFLDFGCGVGVTLALIRDRFPASELWGYDISPESARRAAERVAGAHVTSDAGALPAGSFDVVFTANVLHHVPPEERLEAVEKCRTLLRPEGRMFIFEHNPLNPATRFIFERCPFDAGAVMLPRRETLSLAEKAGLKVARSTYTLFFPRPLSLLRPLERFLGWLPLGAQYCVELEK
jgi:SAM-dependent methyltransferase